MQAAKANASTKACKRVFFLPPKEKLKNKKFATLKKNKTSFHRTMQTLTYTALNVNRFGQSVCKLDTTHLRTDSRAAHNKGLPKAGMTSFYDSFVLNRTLVFQMNGSAEIPRLRQAPKRCASYIDTSRYQELFGLQLYKF